MKIRILLRFLLIGLLFQNCHKTTQNNAIIFENDFMQIELVTPDGPKAIQKLHFLNESVGSCITRIGHIYKTKDKGVTWVKTFNNPVSSNPAVSFTLSDLMFVNNQVGFATGGGSYCHGFGCTLPDGLILKTIDGGDTWQSVLSDPQSVYYAICRDVQNILYATKSVRDQSMTKVFKSTDLGQTWENTSTINNIMGTEMTCNGATIFLTGGSYVGGVLKGIDQGRSWSQSKMDSFVNPKRIEFKNGIGYYLYNEVSKQYDQYLYKTVDNGLNWSKISKFTPNFSSNLNLLSEKNILLFGVIGTASSYKYSSDGGENWTAIELNNQRFTVSHFFNSKMGYISSVDDKLYKVIIK